MNDATEAIEMKKYKLFEIFAPWPLFGLYELSWPLLIYWVVKADPTTQFWLCIS